MKQLNLNQTVYQATQQYPELIGIISDMGFPQIRNEFLRNTLGKKYTIHEAIDVLNLNKEKMFEALINNGFEIIK